MRKFAGTCQPTTFTHMRQSLLFLCLVFAGCGPNLVGDQPTSSSRCLSLSEPSGTGLTSALPSRVGLLFKVDTCGGEPV